MGILGLLQTMVTPKSNGLEGAEKIDYIYIYTIFSDKLSGHWPTLVVQLGGWLMCSLSRGLM